jgi:hypothetical protein
MKLQVAILGLGLSICALGCAYANDATDQAAQMEWAQIFQQKVMQKYHELFFEEMVNIYVKYHEELAELKRSYAQDRAKGDVIINSIKDEMVAMLLPQFLPMIRALMDDMPVGVSEQEKEAFVALFGEQFIVQLPAMLEMNLKENMLIESTAYARVHGRGRNCWLPARAK